MPSKRIRGDEVLNLSRWAKRYYSEGRWLIPTIGKRPIVRDWQSKRPPLEEVLKLIEEGRATGIGVATGKDLGDNTAIYQYDIDEVEAVDIKKTLKYAEQGYINIIVGRNPRIELRLNVVGLKSVKGTTKNGADVEFKGEGRQGVLPPSIHPDTGQPYSYLGKYTPANQLRVLSIEEGKRILLDIVIDPQARKVIERIGQTAENVMIPKELFSLEPQNLVEYFSQQAPDSRPLYAPGRRHYLTLALAKQLRLAGIPLDTAKLIVETVARAFDDEELMDRIRAVETTYLQPIEQTAAKQFFVTAFGGAIDPTTGQVSDGGLYGDPQNLERLYQEFLELIRPFVHERGLYIVVDYYVDEVVVDGEKRVVKRPHTAIVIRGGKEGSVYKLTYRYRKDGTRRKAYSKVISVPLIVKARYETPRGYVYTVKASNFEITGTPDEIAKELKRKSLVLDKNDLEDVLAAIFDAYRGETLKVPPALGVYNENGKFSIYLPDRGPIAPELPNEYAWRVYGRVKERGWELDEESVVKWREYVQRTSNPLKTLFVLSHSILTASSYALNLPIRPVLALVGPKGTGKTSLAKAATVVLFGTPVFTPDSLDSESRVATMFSISTAPFGVDEAHALKNRVIQLLKAGATAPEDIETFRKTTSQSVMRIKSLSVPILTMNEGEVEWLARDEAFSRARIVFLLINEGVSPEKAQELALLLEELKEGPSIGWGLLRELLDGVPVRELKEKVSGTIERLKIRITTRDPRLTIYYAWLIVFTRALADKLGLNYDEEAFITLINQIESTTLIDATTGDLEGFLYELGRLFYDVDEYEPVPFEKDGNLIVTSEILRHINEKLGKARMKTFDSLPRLARALTAIYGLNWETYGPKARRVGARVLKSVLVPLSIVHSVYKVEENESTSSDDPNDPDSIADRILSLARGFSTPFTKDELITKAIELGIPADAAERAFSVLESTGELKVVAPGPLYMLSEKEVSENA